MIYFTSDWHLDHKNIIKYSNRPFNSVDEMNNTIINNMNEVIMPDDDLIFLGDFCFSKDIHRTVELRKRIKCKHFYIIFGNHDDRLREYKDFLWNAGFQCWGDYAEQKFIIGRGEKKLVVLTHYAFKVWRNSHYGSWNLYGHSHGNLLDDPNLLSFDIGVDTNNFKPYSLKDVERIMANKTFKPIDHRRLMI